MHWTAKWVELLYSSPEQLQNGGNVELTLIFSKYHSK
jgi:hypothetical protein